MNMLLYKLFRGKKWGLLLIAGSLLTTRSVAQIFWSETFTNNCNALCTSYTGPQGTWNIVSTGVNDPTANKFYFSCAENGNAANACGSGCGNDASLHIGNDPNSPAAFIFCPTGDCGAAYDGGFGGNDVTTHTRAESPTINCTGKSNINIYFNYLENGDGANDDATLWYYDGASWSQLANMPKTQLCGGGQGLWTAFSTLLPASANNNPNVKIGFQWVNNDDGIASDPSFAVDDIDLSVQNIQPPVADFSSSDTVFCAGTCINFTDLSQNVPTSWSWSFPGATPNSSNLQNPTNICYNTPGTYTVTLTATNAAGSDVETKNTFITVNACNNPVADFSASDSSFCSGTCISFTDLSTNGPTSWSWSFPGGTPNSSNQQNPTNICYNTPGTYAVTLTATNANGSDTEQKNAFITVNACAPPTADFTVSDTTICAGSCIQFTDLSVGATGWSWSFPGGSPSTSIAQNPNVCYANGGTFNVTLTVSNGIGNNTKTKNGYIVVSPSPTVDAGTDVTIGAGESTPLSATGSGNGNYLWSPSLGLSCTACQSTVASPAATTTYYVTYTDPNGCSATDSVIVTVTPDANPYVIYLPNAFSPNGDGHNDVLFVRGKGVKNFNLVIYDRNGEKVFETTDLATGWDGTYKGKALNTSVFVYYLTGELNNATKINQKGDITLTR